MTRKIKCYIMHRVSWFQNKIQKGRVSKYIKQFPQIYNLFQKVVNDFKKSDPQIVCRMLEDIPQIIKNGKHLIYRVTSEPQIQVTLVEIHNTIMNVPKPVQKKSRSKKIAEEEKKELDIQAEEFYFDKATIKTIHNQLGPKKVIPNKKPSKEKEPELIKPRSKSEPRPLPRKRQKVEEEKQPEIHFLVEMIKVQQIKKLPLEEQKEQINQIQQNDKKDEQIEEEEQQQDKKRVKKAVAKKIVKAKKVVVKEEPVLREDVIIPDIIQTKTSDNQEPFINCCQTCSNRNCVRAVLIDSLDLFVRCQKSRAHISSLIEHLAPELRYSALEKAIQLNRVEILEVLLSQDKPEDEFRMKKRESQIAKFETGEVGQMAFGFKVRKVQMMRGNRQGNNAFTEDPSHIYQTPLDYLLQDEFCIDKCFSQDSVQKKTLQLIQKYAGDRFIPFVKNQVLTVLMRHGCQKTLSYLFEIIGHDNDIQNDFFNKVYLQLLTVEKIEEFKINEQDIQSAKLNQVYNYAFVAALNPSGAAFIYLLGQNHEIDFNLNLLSTAHFAAVCATDKNLKILIEREVSLHDIDAKKRTPLMWAIEARRGIDNIATINNELEKSEKDFKDDSKQMALHYFCKFGVDQTISVEEQKILTENIMCMFVQNKAKFSQFGGWNKYTPLIYACTYGNFEIAKYLIENIPRLNINKGDKFQRTPLAMACRNGHADIAALLIKHNAKIDQSDTSGNSPLHYAAAYGWDECVEMLIKYGADPSPENAWKSTPITIALQKNHISIVKELLKSQDINVNSKDDEGRTLLSLAMANINQQSIEFIDLLITSKGADVNQQDAKGKTPLQNLVESMSKRKRGLFQDHDELEHKIVKILIASGASLNLKTKEGKSPFSLAFENGMTELLDIFGSNIDLNQDPSLYFAFSGFTIMKKRVQNLIKECMENKRVDDETINFVENDGFTPMLYYIHQFVINRETTLRAIQNMKIKLVKYIDNESIMEELEKKEQVNYQQISKEAQDIYDAEILQPFMDFLQFLIEQGANPNAYVLKLKQFRDDPLQMTQISQLSQQIQPLGRRPPEKDQYISENLGLCNAIHLLIEDNITIRPLFDYFIKRQGIQLNQVNFQKMTPFFKLVKTKNIKDHADHKYCFEQLIKTGQIDIDAPDQFGMSSFWFFYTNNRLEEAFYLVDQGANINHIDNYGLFALKRELFANNLAMIQRLLEKGANPDTVDEFQRTILHLSCDYSYRRDYKEIFKLLIKHKANLQALDFKGRTPLHYMFVKRNKRNMIDQYDPTNAGLNLLINKETKQFIDINHQDINGKTILHYAAQRGSVESLKYIIKIFGQENIKFDLEDKFKNTILAVAINCRHLQFVQQLIDLKLVKLKGFIYEEPRNIRQIQQNVFQGQNQQQDDEQSDMELMQVQTMNQFKQLDDTLNQKHDKDALNLFRYIIRNNIAELEKAFIQNDYDRIQMVVDYICEGQIGKLFTVIETHFKDHKGAKGSILIQKNEKDQNLIHVLAKNSHLIKDISEITKFYQQLKDEGVNPHDLDSKRRSALHFAVKSGNIHLIKFLVDVENFDVNQIDMKGVNAIVQLIKGDRIIKASSAALMYLLIKGGNPDQLYQEHLYANKDIIRNDEELKENQQSTYRTTCVIHAIRHVSKDRENIRKILKKLLRNANPSLQDTDGKDAFFYAAIRNHFNTFHFMLEKIMKQKQSYDSIVKDSIDNQRKSFIHYIVNPLEYGSYENAEMLQKAFEVGFKHDIQDQNNKTPYDYACLQRSGVMKKIFDDFNFGNGKDIEMVIVEDKKLDNIIFDFETDAKSFLEQIQMQIDPHKFIPCDLSGKFNDDCIVMFDNHTEQHFDVYLTRVEIGKFQPGGDYLFYKMQLVLDQSRDLAILLTRWGRIGEEGAFQKTPFSTHDDAIAEFQKVFDQKTGNKWGKIDKFQKKWRKFQLMRTNYVTIDQKNYLLPFNMENAIQPNNQFVTKEGVEILREICDVNTYLKALQNSGIDAKAMPFSNLDRQNLYDALDVLQKLHKTLTKLEGMNPRPYAENERNKLLATREKMWFLSSRFYEFIPHEEFRNKMVPPISNIDMLLQKSGMIQNLIQIEAASKILLGAHFKADEINPLEYCARASGISFQVLDKQKDFGEYSILENYAINTNIEQEKKEIKNIIRLSKEGESQVFQSGMENRVLLFHGSKVSNFLGIMKHGLKLEPLDVQRNGNLLGKGIYFTDMLSKALQYTNDQNGPLHGSKFVMVCEVALGQSEELARFNNNYKNAQGINSVKGSGRQGPDSKVRVTLPDGAVVPLGKAVAQLGNENSDFQFNEYAVPESNQVRMRYLIQLR